MQENQLPSLEEWVDSHDGLNKKTTELFESDLPVEVQAKKALDYLVQTFGLALMSEDVEDREGVAINGGYFYPISMFEQIAQLRFADPENNDPRYHVMTAAYLLYHNLSIDMSQELGEFLREDKLQGLGYKGKDILKSEFIPVSTGSSWSDLGCTFFVREFG